MNPKSLTVFVFLAIIPSNTSVNLHSMYMIIKPLMAYGKTSSVAPKNKRIGSRKTVTITPRSATMILLFLIFIQYILFAHLLHFDACSAKKINSICKTVCITIHNSFDSRLDDQFRTLNTWRGCHI